MESNGVVPNMRVSENFEEVHILAVDDSFVDRKVIERLLKVLAYKVTAVDSGLRALEYLGLYQQRMPSESDGFIGLKVDLIITDYCMPGMTGYELLKKIKESSIFKEIPVVIMSSENILPRIDRCLEDGAEDFIVKPVKLSDVKRLKDYMTIKEVKGSGDDDDDDGDENGRVSDSRINKRKFHPDSSDVSSSEPSISVKTLSLPSSPSSPLSSSSPSISLIESSIRRLEMMGTD